MEYDGQLNEDDILRARALHGRTRRFRWRLFFFALAVCLLALASGPRAVRFLLGAWAALAMVALVFRFWIVPRRLRRSYQQLRILSMPFHTRIDENGFETRSGADIQVRHWADFRKWKEDASLFLLYEADTVFRIIPKRCLGVGQDETLRSLLAQHLGEAA